MSGAKDKKKKKSKKENSEKKPSSSTNDIDAIFATKATAKVPKALPPPTGAHETASTAVHTKKRKGNDAKATAQGVAYVAPVNAKKSTAVLDDDVFADSRGKRKKRKVVDGLPIYSEEELGLTKNLTGGGTDLCPFDCNCCF